MTKVNWLDDLETLIMRLRVRIEEYGQNLQTNETATRYALIDPLLTALGWDLSDPGQVLAEYPAEGVGKFDYAMLLDGRPRMLVEAKNLGTVQLKKATDQVILYSGRQELHHAKKEILYFVVTNGDCWEGYSLSPTTQVFDFKVSDPTRSGVLRLLWLWRGNMIADHPEVPSTPTEPTSRSFTLAAIRPKGGEKPASIGFPDGHVRNITQWSDVQAAVVEWLSDKGTIRPVSNPGGKDKKEVVAVEKKEYFRFPQRVRSLWIDNQNNSAGHVKYAQHICRTCGEDPAAVTIRLGKL